MGNTQGKCNLREKNNLLDDIVKSTEIVIDSWKSKNKDKDLVTMHLGKCLLILSINLLISPPQPQPHSHLAMLPHCDWGGGEWVVPGRDEQRIPGVYAQKKHSQQVTRCIKNIPVAQLKQVRILNSSRTRKCWRQMIPLVTMGKTSIYTAQKRQSYTTPVSLPRKPLE